MEIRLLVLRTPSPQQITDFYGLLGLRFEYHRHGQGPYHFSAAVGDAVLEIYPLAKAQTAPDEHLRLGFALDNFAQRMQQLQAAGARFLSEPAETTFGYMAVVQDPDGRKLELYRK
jgi:lactoylglutathione lyase